MCAMYILIDDIQDSLDANELQLKEGNKKLEDLRQHTSHSSSLLNCRVGVIIIVQLYKLFV